MTQAGSHTEMKSNGSLNMAFGMRHAVSRLRLYEYLECFLAFRWRGTRMQRSERVKGVKTSYCEQHSARLSVSNPTPF